MDIKVDHVSKAYGEQQILPPECPTHKTSHSVPSDRSADTDTRSPPHRLTESTDKQAVSYIFPEIFAVFLRRQELSRPLGVAKLGEP